MPLEGVHAWTPCFNNGSRPIPPNSAYHQLRHSDGDTARCLVEAADEAKPCDAATRVWSAASDGHVVSDKGILKIYEIDPRSSHGVSGVGTCQQWSRLHVGKDRGDGNVFVVNNGSLRSRLCPGRCAAVLGHGRVRLQNCSDAAAVRGWSIDG